MPSTLTLLNELKRRGGGLGAAGGNVIGQRVGGSTGGLIGAALGGGAGGALGNEYDEAGYIDPSDIYARDEWMCGICGSEIDPTLAYPEPFSASLDHITPVSAGGAHIDGNVRAAHLICNIRRGNRA